ncbi:MAG: hypothetical protein CMI55_04765 [Parcubacteria group bacterium]|jgi:RNA polymerase sigma factor (sigma-70 family)|nr:hypothetical protein [Parcubacteria group bacterium]|tara:strand:+ start:382 stop:1182 length:801 start_codon:yes stop_codon:yes gene_type:complete
MNHEEAKALLESNLNITNEVVRKFCYRHSITGDDADECNSYVYEKLLENGCRKIREFKGGSSYKTYITVVISRILIDRMRSGRRWRPSQKAMDMGEDAVILEELVYRKNYSFEQAYSTLTTNHGASISRDRAYEMVTLLQRRHVRSKRPRVVELMDNVSDERDIAPDRAAVMKEISEKKGRLENVMENIRESLSDEDRLLLRMRFEGNVKISKIARVLKRERNYVDKKLKTIFVIFREELLSRDISIGDLKDIITSGISGGESVSG